MSTVAVTASRCLLAAAVRGNATTPPTPGKVRVTFIVRDGSRKQVLAPVGVSLMEAGVENGIDIEAACDGTCACSTCHCYLDDASFARLPKATDDELDMLDLAVAVKKTSRLACQVKLTQELDGAITATLPAEVANQLK